MNLFDKPQLDKTTGMYSHTKRVIHITYSELPATPWNVLKMGIYNLIQPNPLKRLQFVNTHKEPEKKDTHADSLE